MQFKEFCYKLELIKKNYANVCVKLGYKVCRTCVPDSIQANSLQKVENIIQN
jgi:hypothetical protein